MRALRSLPDDLKAPVVQVVRSEGERAAAVMRGKVPVDTGFLKSTIRARYSQKGLRVRVGVFGSGRTMNRAALLVAVKGVSRRKALRAAGKSTRDAFYARFIEFGTVKMPARSFIHETWIQRRSIVRARILDAARKVIAAQNRRA